ncbi:MAG: hypothetical protein ABEH65_08510 [Halobacteriales archaeon]
MSCEEIDVDPEKFDQFPSTEIEVESHVHFGMTGSFPLRMAEIFFADDGLHVAEYAYITPMFGLGAKRHKREAASMQAIYDIHGLDEVLLRSDSVYWFSYDAIDRIVLYTGSWLGRPKLGIYPKNEASHAYRLHDDVEFEALADELRETASKHDLTCEVKYELGFTPIESIRRFYNR